MTEVLLSVLSALKNLTMVNLVFIWPVREVDTNLAYMLCGIAFCNDSHCALALWIILGSHVEDCLISQVISGAGDTATFD